jgi:hypothetical protein
MLINSGLQAGEKTNLFFYQDLSPDNSFAISDSLA